jgi:quinol monooxygenase YgiN
MVILQVHIRVKPESVAAFRAATMENARNSALEPGIARFDLLQLADAPDRFCLWEVYRTEEAVAAHKQTAHYAAWVEATADMFAEPRSRTWYKSVYPHDATW